MRVKIGSFNVHNLADGQGRDIDRIAKIINDNHLDIVCMQEVLGKGDIIAGKQLREPSGRARAYNRSILSRLNGKWDSCWETPKLRKENEEFLGEDRRGEGYAILWRTDKFDLPKDKYGRDVRPYIYNNYRPTIVDSKLGLTRDPLYARFVIPGRPVELRIITTHIIYGKPKAVADEIDYGAITMRKKEFQMLAGQIYYRVSESYKSIKASCPYTIMMGDYNLNLNSSLDCVMTFDKNGKIVPPGTEGQFTVKTIQDEKTTLKKNEPGLANSYDHFSMNDYVLKNIVQKDSVRVVDGVHKYAKAEDRTEEEMYSRYLKEVSDHLPIVIEVNI